MAHRNCRFIRFRREAVEQFHCLCVFGVLTPARRSRQHLPVVPFSNRRLRLPQLCSNPLASWIGPVNFGEVSNLLDSLPKVMQVSLFQNWKLRSHMFKLVEQRLSLIRIDLVHPIAGSLLKTDGGRQQIFVTLLNFPCEFEASTHALACQPVFKLGNLTARLPSRSRHIFDSPAQRIAQLAQFADPDIQFPDGSQSIAQPVREFAEAQHRLRLVARHWQIVELVFYFRLNAKRDDPKRMHTLPRGLACAVFQQFPPNRKPVTQRLRFGSAGSRA